MLSHRRSRTLRALLLGATLLAALPAGAASRPSGASSAPWISPFRDWWSGFLVACGLLSSPPAQASLEDDNGCHVDPSGACTSGH